MAGWWNAGPRPRLSPILPPIIPRICWRRLRAGRLCKGGLMRIAVAEFKQETNTFVPFTTTVETFTEQYLHRGADMLTAFGKARLEIPGALDAIREAGAVPVPLLATMAMASGTVERKSFDILMGR